MRPDYLAVFGHDEIRRRLGRAVESRRLPQSLLLHGPRGVGKQRLALWTAAALNCQSAAPRPCGTCRSCRLAASLQHPDIHWFFPLPRPKRASGRDQLRKKLEDSRAAALQERRQNPLYLEEAEEAAGIYVAAVHVMRILAQKAPAMGPAKLFVVGRAEALVSQAASPEAANALLKLLEEPPADTWLILTSDVPGALLPTIRSRVQAIRVPPLPDDRVAEFLRTAAGLPAAAASALAARSGGAIGRALELQADEREEIQRSAAEIVRALLDGRRQVLFAAAHRYRSTGARGGFGRVIAEARALLRDLLAPGGGTAAQARQAAAPGTAPGQTPDTRRIIRSLDALDRAAQLAARNVNPQLIVVNLLPPECVSENESTVRVGGGGGGS